MGFRGLLKKVFIFALVALATVIDRMIPAANQAIRAAVIAFYVANEGISILENAGEIGLPMPGALRTALKNSPKREKRTKRTPDILCRAGESIIMA